LLAVYTAYKGTQVGFKYNPQCYDQYMYILYFIIPLWYLVVRDVGLSFCDLTHSSSFILLQIDICQEEIGNNVLPAVGMVGDLKSVLAQVRKY